MEKRSGQYNFSRVRCASRAPLAPPFAPRSRARVEGLRSATAPIGRGRRPRSRPTPTPTPPPTRGASTRSRAFDSLRTLRNFTIATGVTERGRLDAPRVVFTLDSSSRVTLDHSFSYSNACIRHDASTRDDRPDNLHRPVTTGRWTSTARKDIVGRWRVGRSIDRSNRFDSRPRVDGWMDG